VPRVRPVGPGGRTRCGARSRCGRSAPPAGFEPATVGLEVWPEGVWQVESGSLKRIRSMEFRRVQWSRGPIWGPSCARRRGNWQRTNGAVAVALFVLRQFRRATGARRAWRLVRGGRPPTLLPGWCASGPASGPRPRSRSRTRGDGHRSRAVRNRSARERPRFRRRSRSGWRPPR